MGIKGTLIRPFAALAAGTVNRIRANAIKDQNKWFKRLISKAAGTQFGKDHFFHEIKNHKDFSQRVPLRDYEALRVYIDKILNGEASVLWPGKPKYLAKTSGTTSGVKYIPITADSMPNHIVSMRTALLNFVHLKKQHSIFDGRVIFLSGSPKLDQKAGIPTGRLSGIVNHEIPFWLKGNQLPSFSTNCIEEWEEKLEKIVEETVHVDMRLISGIPPWVQMYYESLIAHSGKKTIKDLFPNFSLFIYGGVNYEPYRNSLDALVGKEVHSLETYPASEGFIAFQDSFPSEGLLLNTNSGIWFEFVPLEDMNQPEPRRLGLEEVCTGVDYVVIINNNAGLWGYNIGDTVRFVSTDPYRVVVSGRVKHFISAFGEHVIGKEVESAMQATLLEHPAEIVEFTVAPQITPPEGGLPYHEWFIEFSSPPSDLIAFSAKLDREMVNQNIYYADLIQGKILRPLVVTSLRPDSFRLFMKKEGKLGGQNKVPRLMNDRKIADVLKAL